MVYLTFTKPVFLWFLLVLPLLYLGHYVFLARTQHKAMRFANFIALKRIAGGKFVTKNITILLLRTLILLLVIISLSGTEIWYETEISDYDYVFTLDTSSSMVNEDIPPSRLEFAKKGALLFLDYFEPDVHFGLVTFSSLTFIVSPLTRDKLTTRININSLNVTRNSGTDLSNAIVTSTNVLANSQRSKSMIIFTDGSNTIDSSMQKPLEEALNYAKRNQVVIHTVGIGTDKAPVGYLPKIYNLQSNIDRETIEYISSETGGLSIYPENEDDLKSFYDQLGQKNTLGYASFDFTFWGIMFAFILLFIEWSLINLIFRRVV